MTRVLTLTLAALLSAAAFAADPPKPKASATVQLAVASVIDDKLTYELTVMNTLMENKTEERELNGRKVFVTVPVPRKVDEKRVIASPLDQVKATTADGKELAAADLKKRLDGGKPVVLLDGPLPAEWKGLFTSDAVFVEPKK
jgi:uncharacterized protein YqgV (UPF0045/DUF77 family)